MSTESTPPAPTGAVTLLRRGGPDRFRKVLVCGVGRSGTTAVAAVLAALGFHLGDEPVPHLHEDTALRRLLLQGDAAGLAAALEQMATRHAAVGWKDPKIHSAVNGGFVRLLPDDWLLVGVLRDPVAVAQRRRFSDGDEVLPTALDVARFQLKLLQFLQGAAQSVALISYERFIVDTTAAVGQLLELLQTPGLPPEPAALARQVLAEQAVYRSNTLPRDPQRTPA